MTHSSLLSPLLASLLLVGCAAGADDFSPSHNKADEGVAAAARSGSMVVQMITSADSCGFDEALHEPEIVDVIASDDGNHFEYEEDGSLVSCDRNAEGRYDCDMTSEAAELFDLKVTMDVSWTGDGRFIGATTMKMDCTETMSEEFCNNLAASLPNGLPCEVSADIIASSPAAEDFKPSVGTYALSVGEALPVSSCATAFPVTPRQNALLEDGGQDGDFQILDDDGGAFKPFECFNFGDGVVECKRRLEFEGLSIDSQIISVFTGKGVTEGALEVTLDCVSDDPAVCEDLSESFGEFPCRSVQAVSASLADGTDA